MKFERYDSYKDSEIEWLGKIPSEWDIVTIKNIFREFGSGSTPQSNNIHYYDNGTINWLNTSDLKQFIIFDTKFKITDLALKEVGLRVYPKTTIAVAMYGQGETRGTPALLKVSSTTNQASCMMYKTFIADERYILWWFTSKKSSLRAISVGATQPNMNADFIKNLFVALPNKQNQIKIANFLDTKTQKIDNEISLLEQKIKKYQELKQALINETILRGLDKDVELKDSGTQWIGDIPTHWDIDRGKYIFKENPKSKITANDGNSTGKYKFFTSSSKQTKWLDYYSIVKASMLFSTGGVANVDYCDEKYSYSTDTWSLSKKEISNILLKYYFFYFQAILYNIQILAFKGSGLKHLQKDFIKLNQLPKPPYEEQVQIANYLDEKTIKIDEIVKTVGTKIKLLKEFRKTLVNDVVTGKVKVS